ncbi:MAG: response regulator [Lachnospiraceae bacterium]|nr:response regulator [Lachnospiraceae bacterium]
MAKVLIVDDSKMSRRMLRTIIEGIGHEIVGEGANGEEGVKLYKETKPDIVTMDITMPEMDGINCLKAIKEFDADANVIMVTAAGQSAKLMDALKAGAKEFICKPYEPEQVINAVKEVLK